MPYQHHPASPLQVSRNESTRKVQVLACMRPAADAGSRGCHGDDVNDDDDVCDDDDDDDDDCSATNS